jgi:hypothetical protein
MELHRLSHHTLGTLALLSLLGIAACNSLTGIDQIVLVSTDSDFGSSSGEEEGSGDVGAGPAGVGGGSDVGGNDAGGSNAGGSNVGGSNGAGAGHPDGGQGGQGGQGGTTSSSTAESSSSSSSTSTGGPVDCVYPDSGFGVQIGNYVQGNLAWQGFSEGAAQSGSMSIQDYFDCDGSRGINALLIINSAEWCGACQSEAGDLPSHAAAFASKGIRIITLLVENNAGQPATMSTATTWRNNFGLDAYATAADPNFSFAGVGSVGLPLNIIVDPRTMKIVGREEGFGDYSAVTQLAAQNAN